MQYEKILIVILVVIAIGGLVWSAASFMKGDDGISIVENTSENYQRALDAELTDKCRAPDGYSDEQWREHMSHHPDRYSECLNPRGENKIITYQNIGPDNLAAVLKNKDFVLIDTHIPEQAHIPGTDLFIPFNEIALRQAELPQDKDTKIVVYCRSGSMSKTASAALVEMGYMNVFNLEGGVNAWKQAGYKVE